MLLTALLLVASSSPPPPPPPSPEDVSSLLPTGDEGGRGSAAGSMTSVGAGDIAGGGPDGSGTCTLGSAIVIAAGGREFVMGVTAAVFDPGAMDSTALGRTVGAGMEGEQSKLTSLTEYVSSELLSELSEPSLSPPLSGC
jgi:hypothetical protein